MKVLLVEDDPMIGAAVRTGLRQDGHDVDWVTDGVAADAAARSAAFDILLLDLGLPGRSGIDVLRGLRRAKHDTPVIIITARDATRDRVAGLDAGADDYLVKPFDLDELAARIRAVLRRRTGGAGKLLEYRDLRLDVVSHEVHVGDRRVELSSREFAILEMLIERPSAIVTRQRLEDRLYGWHGEIGSNAVEVHIHHLRRKLGEDRIRTVRGLGYTLSAAS